jgi:hypothetical protein
LRIGKPQSASARIERGQRRVDVIEFVQLAMVIGFDPMRVLSHIVRARGATRERIVLLSCGVMGMTDSRWPVKHSTSAF